MIVKETLAAVALLVLGLVICKPADASDWSFRGSFTPSFSYLRVEKYPNSFGNTVSTRAVNPGFNFFGSFNHVSGIGGSFKIDYIPSEVSASGLTADLDIVGVTFGPNYIFKMGSNQKLHGVVDLGIGYYNTNIELLGASRDQNSFGVNGSFSVEYQALNHMIVGGKATVHYILDTGLSNHDCLIFSVGPTVGVFF